MSRYLTSPSLAAKRVYHTGPTLATVGRSVPPPDVLGGRIFSAAFFPTARQVKLAARVVMVRRAGPSPGPWVCSSAVRRRLALARSANTKSHSRGERRPLRPKPPGSREGAPAARPERHRAERTDLPNASDGTARRACRGRGQPSTGPARQARPPRPATRFGMSGRAARHAPPTGGRGGGGLPLGGQGGAHPPPGGAGSEAGRRAPRGGPRPTGAERESAGQGGAMMAPHCPSPARGSDPLSG